MAFVRFFHCKVTLFPPFPYCALWKEVTVSSLHLESGELSPTFLRAEYLYKLFGILHEKRVCFPPFIYLFNHLLISVYIHGCLLHTLGYNSVLLYFVAEMVSALAMGSSSVGSCVPLTYYITVGMLFCILEQLLTFWY